MSVTSTGNSKRNRSVRFEANGSWVVPPGVYWVEVELCGGGGGCASAGAANTGVAGSNSSVALATETVVGPAQKGAPISAYRNDIGADAPANSGRGALFAGSGYPSNVRWGSNQEPDLTPVIVNAGGAVVPGSTVSVTIGAGGISTHNGGSGYAIINYEV